MWTKDDLERVAKPHSEAHANASQTLQRAILAYARWKNLTLQDNTDTDNLKAELDVLIDGLTYDEIATLQQPMSLMRDLALYKRDREETMLGHARTKEGLQEQAELSRATAGMPSEGIEARLRAEEERIARETEARQRLKLPPLSPDEDRGL
jgi:hypothetical protein